MAIRKPDARQKARQLREEGWTLRRIANEVGAALSTVSLWIRDIQPPPIPTSPSSSAAASGENQDEQGSRRCGRCRQYLPLTRFSRHPDGRQWWCRDCFQHYFRARGELHLDQIQSARHRRRQKGRAFLSLYLRSHHGSDCGEADPLVLELDHIAGKRGGLGALVDRGASIRRLEQELVNCEVVCVNCHRVRTAARGRSWRSDPASLESNPCLTAGEQRNMAYVRELLLHSSCVDCGDARLVVLEFDHVGAKRGTVVELARRGSSRLRLQAEISQCEIRCANCHRRRTRSALVVEGTNEGRGE